MDRYELVEGSSAKFWEADVTGTTLTVRFGRLGTQGQSKDKTFPDEAAAVKEKDKLVREKTAKGYARVGAAPAAAVEQAAPASATAGKTTAGKTTTGKTTASKATPKASKVAPPEEAPPEPPGDPVSLAAEPEAASVAKAAAGPSAPTPSGAVFDGTPLPTRLRPGRHLTGEEALRAVRATLPALVGDTESLRLIETMPTPDGMGDWIRSIWDLAEDETEHRSFRAGTHHAADLLRFMDAALRFLVESGGAMEAARFADRMRPGTRRQGHYQNLAWAAPLQLATRAALVHATDADYDAAVAFLNDRIAEAPDWPTAAAFAFILADDRPARHGLQPLAVLEAASAAGIDVAADRNFLPLVTDSDPAAAAPWRTKRSYHMYFGDGVNESDAAATLIAVARSTGQPALPGLDWILHYALDEQRTAVARAMLSTGEPGALATLLPHLHEKPIAAALDAALAADPAAIVPRCLAVLAGGRAEPALRARAVRALDTHGPDTIRGWIGDTDGRAARFLDGLVQARAVPLAERAAWPRVLRDPPWRARMRGADDLVLDLAPLPTPFAFEAMEVPDNHWRGYRARILNDMSELPAFIEAAETAKPEQDWVKIPPALSPPPLDDPNALLEWLATRLRQIDQSCRYWVSSPYHGLVGSTEKQPAPLALKLWSLTGILVGHSHISLWPEIVARMLSRFGETAMPGLIALIEADPVGLLPTVLAIDAEGLAPPAARALVKLKKARTPALAWLRRHRSTAITRLVPDAVGKPGATRDAAEHALRVFVSDRPDGRAAIEAVVAAYVDREPRVAAAVAQVLDRDPLGRVPAKVGKPPAWVVPGALAKPCLRAGGALPDEAVGTLCEMLSFTNPDAVYAGVPMVREACTPESLAAFAWDLFSAWTAAGTPSKDGWALRTLGWFGDDGTARDLTRLIRRWPGEAAHVRAVTGLDVLVDIGSDVALMNLNGIAEKLKFKGLQEKAREKIAQLAEARGLSPEELSDRLAPDLDLDERGGLDLDFGTRQFRAGFDEVLKPWVRDAAGARLKDLPKPIKSDDAEKAAAATARWSALKKDARAVASLQVARLEAMLVTSRRVRPEVFGPFFSAHPLVRHLTQRLVWGTFADADPRTLPTATFRVAEDLSFTDGVDAPAEIDLAPEAAGLIGLVHPLHLDPDVLTAWGTLFGDYEIAQPFPQLGRETFAFTEAERGAAKTKRFEGVVVESKRLRGMPARGWRLGDPQDGGGIWWIEHAFLFSGGAPGKASLTFADGLFTGAPEFEEASQTLGELTLESPWGAPSTGANQRGFGDLDPVTASELLRSPSLLAETRLR
ncbi:DUF4132 domain-containing protein [Methylobacterium sp. Leaf100]|uniref:DUF4132 domain-containing protein n=1 Tax=Methylobacterium sp. Leaf100 TaxID=1736252 RepID=UPI0007008F24|nr:DUF4132 domain-containing protein [Methylobacterium sp. Leaf100]KQP18998.1 molybdate metabolism regulator [Methylobacterium sp. Leaf100]